MMTAAPGMAGRIDASVVFVRSAGDGGEQTIEHCRPRSGRTRNCCWPGEGITLLPNEHRWFRPKIAKRRRRHSGTVPHLKKSAFVLMTDFKKAGILREITEIDYYISTGYKLFLEMRSVNGGREYVPGRRRTARRPSAVSPLISRSMSNSASIRFTASTARGEIGGACLLRLLPAAMSASS